MSKNYEEAFPGRIAVGSDGLGTVNQEMIEQRALELAKADGRSHVNESDLANARQELLSHGEYVATPPEAEDAAMENLTSWDQVPGQTGGRVEQMEPLDEANIAEQLVEEGLAEADHDQRVSASEDNPPEEL